MLSHSRNRPLALATLLALAPAWSELLAQQFTGAGLARREAQPGALTAQEIQQQVGFDQQLGAKVPLDLPMRDETGKAVLLGDYFGDRPVLLALVYYRCPVLCTQVSVGVAASLKPLSWRAGQEFDVVFASFDPTDTPEMAAEKKAATIARLGDPGAASGFHFLTGDAESVAKLASSVGFRYAYDETTRQYAHASGVVALTPGGEVSRYLYGVEYAPKDLKLALFEAGEGKVGGLSEKLMLLCFNYDAALGKYTAATMISLKLAATLTLLVLGGGIFWMLRAERRKLRNPGDTGNSRSGGAPVEGAASV